MLAELSVRCLMTRSSTHTLPLTACSSAYTILHPMLIPDPRQRRCGTDGGMHGKSQQGEAYATTYVRMYVHTKVRQGNSKGTTALPKIRTISNMADNVVVVLQWRTSSRGRDGGKKKQYLHNGIDL